MDDALTDLPELGSKDREPAEVRDAKRTVHCAYLRRKARARRVASECERSTSRYPAAQKEWAHIGREQKGSDVLLLLAHYSAADRHSLKALRGTTTPRRATDGKGGFWRLL
jgi:hypothetical protein